MINIRKTISVLFTFFVISQCAFAQTIVTTEAELTAAVLTDNAQIRFANDIATSSLLEITNSRTVTIDMNGFTLDRGCTSRSSQVIVIRTGSTLNLSNGTLTGGWGGNGGALDIETNTTVNLTDVIITGNTADDRGGGIANSGTLTMIGGAISGNTSRDNVSNEGGGGLVNYANCTATLTNVTISDNEATYGGGLCNRGTLAMEGCTISDNFADYIGGGISNEGTLTMTDCAVSSNKCFNLSLPTRGNGIYNHGTLNLQGNVQIKDNNDDDIYLRTGSKITVTGELTGGPGSIGVRMQTLGVFTNGYQSHNSETDHFFSDIIPNAIDLVNGEMIMRYGYYECLWDSENKQLVHTMSSLPDYIPITNVCDINNGGVLWGKDRWFIAEGTGSTVNGLTCNGDDIYLILCDDAEYTIHEGFFVNAGTTLHVYSQSYGDRMGKLICYGDDSQPGIGPKHDGSNAGNIDIHGGNIRATGGKYAAGIGGCEDRGSGTITIWDGNIEATGGTDAAGIGGGEGGSGTYTYIYGGNITATGTDYGAGIGGGEYSGGGGDCGHIEIFGGTIEASGSEIAFEGGGAGIGTGDHGDQKEESPIIIHGGVVTATGGYWAAGIGSGYGANAREIIINGGIVMAYGSTTAAAIGGGCADADGPMWEEPYGGNARLITINGGFVSAFAHSSQISLAAAIGGGEGGAAGIEINDGIVFACSDDGAAIGSGVGGISSAVDIRGGSVVAIALVGGAGIGSGKYGSTSFGYVRIYGGEVMAMGGAHKNLKSYASDPFGADKFITYLSKALLSLRGSSPGAEIMEILTASVVLVLQAVTEYIDEDKYGGAGIGTGYDDAHGEKWFILIDGGYVVAHGGRSGAEAIGRGYDGEEQVGTLISQGIMVSAGSNENNYAPVSFANRISACRNNQYVYIQPCGHKDADSYTDNGDGTYSINNEDGCHYCGIEGEQTCHHTFTDDGDWNDANNWNSGHVPNDGNDVIICAHCEIPADYTVKADDINVPYYDTIFIKEAGQLIHSNSGVQAQVETSIMHWTVEQNHDDILTDGWYFISSPFTEGYTPDANMLSNTYDLYRLNNTTWENFKNTEEHPDFITLNNGIGYLYANSEDVTLKFNGKLKPYSESDGANQVAVNPGWNLIGNPFACNVYADRVFYKMNDERTAIEAVESYSSTPIAPVTGIVVNADGAGTVTFKKDMSVTSTDNGSLQIKLAKVCNNRDASTRSAIVQDNAIVTFNEGTTLPKFRFGNNAEIYIPQDGNDYAIAFADKSGEMPLHFVAKETGRYAINFDGTDLNNIKLIDKFENKIIDLNINNSYTFIGSPADSHDRFLLVFKGSEFSDGSDIFAYQSGTDIIINGNGELQVFDVMGRMVMRKHVNGVETFPETSLQTGVYIFRLNEKTQKIVIK